MTRSDFILETKSLSKTWKEFAIKNINISIHPREYFVVMGPTGAGKTLLLQLLAGIHYPDSGRIILDGVDVTDLPPERREVGYVPQNYALFPHMSVRDNIAYGLRIRGHPKNEVNKVVRDVSEKLGIENLLDRRVSTLSGGEQQRTALARALAVKPKILLLDEPLSALDKETREEVRSYLKKLRKDMGFTAIHVTHDFIEASDLGDRIAVMFNGEILQIGGTREIIYKPRNRLVASFTGFKNIFKGEVVSRKGELAEIEIDGVRIYAVTSREGEEVAAIRPESILVTIEAIKMSARNILKGVIEEVAEFPPYMVLRINAGIPFMIYLTKNAVEDLDLRKGKQVYIAFKASDVIIL